MENAPHKHFSGIRNSGCMGILIARSQQRAAEIDYSAEVQREHRE